MIPILFKEDYTDLSDSRKYLGSLKDTLNCEVTEERNGQYELELSYDPTGALAEELAVRRIIGVVPHQGGDIQPFRIYQVERTLSAVYVYAHHISYDLNKIIVNPFSAVGITATLSGIDSNMQRLTGYDTTAWTFVTDITNESSNYEQTIPEPVRSRLGGTVGSVLDVFGGEYEWDGTTVHLWSARGQDRGALIKYGENLVRFVSDKDGAESYTHVQCYYYNEDTGTLVVSDALPVSETVTNAPTSATKLMDVSDKFEETAPTKTQLNALLAPYQTSTKYSPSEGFEVEFVDLYSDAEAGVAVPINLCDTVRIMPKQKYGYEDGDLLTAKVVRTVWNVLLDRYDSITVGTPTITLADTISDMSADMETGAIRKVVYDDFAFEVSYSAGTIGTRGYQGSLDITKSGCVPFSATIIYVGSSASYIPVAFLSSTQRLLYCNAYRCTTSAVSSSNIRVRVAYLAWE